MKFLSLIPMSSREIANLNKFGMYAYIHKHACVYIHDNVLFLLVIQSNCTQLSSSANGQMVPCNSNAARVHHE